MTSTLPPSAYGELALGMAIASFAQQVFLAPLAAALLRFFAEISADRENVAYSMAATVLARLVAVWLVVFSLLVMSVAWLSGFQKYLGLLGAALVFAGVSGTNSVIDALQNAGRFRVTVAWHQSLAEWSRFIGGFLLVIATGGGSTHALFGYVVGSLFTLGSQAWFLRRRLPSINSVAPVKSDISAAVLQMRLYAWPFAVWGGFTWLQTMSDRWALQFARGSEQVGMYAVLYQLGFYPLALASGALTQLVAPVVFARAGGHHSENALGSNTIQRSTLIIFCGIVAFVTIAGFFFHDMIFRLFVAGPYRAVAWLLPFMMLSAGLFGAGQVVVLRVLGQRHSAGLIVPKIATAVLGIVLNFVGAIWLGVPGVVFAGLTTSTVYLASVCWGADNTRRSPH
jgi:O-antigen/teichoic acid export membrane protein